MLFFIFNMRIIKLIPILFILAACRTPSPQLISFYVSEGVIQHFISPTMWTSTTDKNTRAKLDITYRTGVETPATVNVSFYGNKITPKDVSNVSLQGAEFECKLNVLYVIFVEQTSNELRISFSADRDDLVDMLEMEPVITLKADIDGTSYTFTPEKHFYTLRDNFLILALQY